LAVVLLNNRYAMQPVSKSGGMADVHRATDLLHDEHRTVAVKLFRYGSLDESILNESFRRETVALRELLHENIVELLDSGIDPESKRLFVVLEWVDQSLTEWLKTNPISSWQEFYSDVGRGVLSALHYAHSRRFTHRDV